MPEGGLTGLLIEGWPILVSRHAGAVYAVIDQCTHANSPLSGGRVRRGTVMCPLHGARFDLATGKCLGATYRPLRTFGTRTTEGWIEVEVPDAPPGAEYTAILPRI